MAKMALIERELKRDKLAAKYAKKYANYILFDTLSHFPWFRDENKEKGEVIHLFPAAPPQYFYSLKELKIYKGIVYLFRYVYLLE